MNDDFTLGFFGFSRGVENHLQVVKKLAPKIVHGGVIFWAHVKPEGIKVFVYVLFIGCLKEHFDFFVFEEPIKDNLILCFIVLF